MRNRHKKADTEKIRSQIKNMLAMRCPFCGGNLEEFELEVEKVGEYELRTSEFYCDECKKVVGGFGDELVDNC